MIYIVTFILELILVVLLEKSLWKTYLTPMVCISFPCGMVTLLAIIYPFISSDFPKFYIPSLSVWMIGILVFELPSLILSRAVKKPHYQIVVSHKRDRKIYNGLLVMGFLLTAYAFMKMKSVMGQTSWGSDDFSEQYSSSSIIGHFSVIISTIFAYMIFTGDRKHKLAYVYIPIALISMYGIGVKSWIIAPIMTGLLAKIYTKKMKISAKFILLTCLCFFMVFAVSYIILMVGAGKSELNEDFYRFILNHFMFYLIGSPLSFSLDYQYGIIEPYMLKELFAPPINMLRLFSGESFLTPINPVGIPIVHGYANVRTFFGTLFAYSHSWWGLIIISIIFSFVAYGLFVLALSNRDNPFLILANCSNLTFLVLGFFEFYWLNLGPYEMLFIFLCLAFLYRFMPLSWKREKNVC